MGYERRMIRSLVYVATVLLSIAPAGAATQPYTLSYFDAIRLEAPVSVMVKTGGGVSARGEGDRALLDRIEIRVAGSTLVVRMRPAAIGETMPQRGRVTLTLSTERIRSAQVEGSGSLTLDAMSGLAGNVVISGNGQATITAVKLDKLTVIVGGPGRVTLTGVAQDANLQMLGTGAIEAGALVVRRAVLGNMGPGIVNVAASDTARVTAKGPGDVVVIGKAACTVEHAGAGRVSCGGVEY